MPNVLMLPNSAFNRPADTNAYTTGDLVANSVTALSVVPLKFVVNNDVHGRLIWIRRARLRTNNLTLTGGTFRLHLYSNDPSLSAGIVNGDNGAWSTASSGYLGSFTLDLTLTTAAVQSFTDVAFVSAIPDVGTDIAHYLTNAKTTVFGLLEVLGSYTPASDQTFTLDLELVSE